jgi:hypothetical protein
MEGQKGTEIHFQHLRPPPLSSTIGFVAQTLTQDICRNRFDWDDLAEKITATKQHGTARARIWRQKWASGRRLHTIFFSYGSASVRFVISKSSVAPLNILTNPSLELNAAVFAARIGTQVHFKLDFVFNGLLYWTDSTTILSWIKYRNCHFNNYVGNRVEDIFKSSTPDQFNDVPNASNPADDASWCLETSNFTVGSLVNPLKRSRRKAFTQSSFSSRRKRSRDPRNSLGLTCAAGERQD